MSYETRDSESLEILKADLNKLAKVMTEKIHFLMKILHSILL